MDGDVSRNAVQPSMEDLTAASPLVGTLGGLAGIGTAIAAFLLFIYRRGYRDGKAAEARKEQARTLEKIEDQLKGK